MGDKERGYALNNTFGVRAKAATREYESAGRQYVVFSCVGLLPGVYHGLYYSKELIQKTFYLWDGAEVCCPEHPHVGGYQLTGNEEEAMQFCIGRVRNTDVDEDGRLLMELHVDKDLAYSLGHWDVMERLLRGDQIETSGSDYVFYTIGEGKFGEEGYMAKVDWVAPLHQAILGEQTGACSLEDGCGVNRKSEGVGVRSITESEFRGVDNKNLLLYTKDKDGSECGSSCGCESCTDKREVTEMEEKIDQLMADMKDLADRVTALEESGGSDDEMMAEDESMKSDKSDKDVVSSNDDEIKSLRAAVLELSGKFDTLAKADADKGVEVAKSVGTDQEIDFGVAQGSASGSDMDADALIDQRARSAYAKK